MEQNNGSRSLRKLYVAACNDTSHASFIQLNYIILPQLVKQHSGSCGKRCLPQKLRRLLTYKDNSMQSVKIDAIWYVKYSPGPFGLCATAVKEEEEEEEEETKFDVLSTCGHTFARKQG